MGTLIDSRRHTNVIIINNEIRNTTMQEKILI